MKFFLIKFKTFIKSLVWHINNGLPKSTQEQINDRFNICISCDSYDKQDRQCLECGCNINNKRIFLNKLAWADQKCPIGKWNNFI
jgi:hypothetical protein